MSDCENVKDKKNSSSVKRLTIDVSTDLFCKIKAHASFMNTNLKCFVSSILYKEICKIEKEERAKLASKK